MFWSCNKPHAGRNLVEGLRPRGDRWEKMADCPAVIDLVLRLRRTGHRRQKLTSPSKVISGAPDRLVERPLHLRGDEGGNDVVFNLLRHFSFPMIAQTGNLSLRHVVFRLVRLRSFACSLDGERKPL